MASDPGQLSMIHAREAKKFAVGTGGPTPLDFEISTGPLAAALGGHDPNVGYVVGGRTRYTLTGTNIAISRPTAQPRSPAYHYSHGPGDQLAETQWPKGVRVENAGMAPKAWPPWETFPLEQRLDLPEHERAISAAALSMLDQGIADVLAGRVQRIAIKDLDEGDDE